MNLAKTVGELRELLSDLNDDAVIFPHFIDGPPGDDEPGVSLYGFRIGTHPGKTTPCLLAEVGLFYLDDNWEHDDDWEHIDD